MLLAKSIHLYGLDDICFADIYCSDTEKDEVIACLTDLWVNERQKAWKKLCSDYPTIDYLLDEVGEIEYNSDYGKDDVVINKTDFGVRIEPGNLAVGRRNRRCFPDAYVNSFKNALKLLKKKFRSIKYYAYIVYLWSDEREGGIEHWEFNSKNEDTSERTYDYIADAIKDIDIEGLSMAIDEIDNGMDWDYRSFYYYDDVDEPVDNYIEIGMILKTFRMYINSVSDELFDECGLLELAAKTGDIPFLTTASKHITKDNIDNLIDTAQENEKTECTAWLMNFKNDNIGFDTSEDIIV